MPALTAKPVASASFTLHSPPAMPTATALPLRQGKHSNAFVAPEVRLNKTAAEENWNENSAGQTNSRQLIAFLKYHPHPTHIPPSFCLLLSTPAKNISFIYRYASWIYISIYIIHMSTAAAVSFSRTVSLLNFDEFAELRISGLRHGIFHLPSTWPPSRLRRAVDCIWNYD